MATSFVLSDIAACHVSPLMLADQLLTLAKDADRAGMRRPAEQLLFLAFAVYDEKPAYA